jgi:hypothetical protein
MAALVVVAFMPIQIAVYVMYPPPTTVTEWFSLFQENWIIALLDMDLLIVVEYVLLLLLYVALWAVLRQWNGAFATLALVLQIVGTATYFSSAVAFEMLSLSNEYAAATTGDEKSIILAAGHAILANWQGTAFSISYVLAGAATLTISLVIPKTRYLFGRGAAYSGIIAGTFSLVPSTARLLGVVLSLLSLAPLAVWLVLVSRRLLKPRSLSANHMKS